MSLFNYKLKPIEQCALPGDKKKSLAWFWITDSEYYIELGEVKLFENSCESIKKYPNQPQYLDYQYVRFLEDFFDILPSVAAPIPPEIFHYIDTIDKKERLAEKLSSWYDSIDNPTEEHGAIETDVLELLWEGNLDTGFLSVCSQCWFYRIDDTVKIQYDFRENEEDGTPIWSATFGEYELPWHVFVDEVEDLLVRFFRDMDKQVENAVALLESDKNYTAYETVAKGGSLKYDNKLGIESLLKEHNERKNQFWNVLNEVKRNAQPSENWSKIKSSVEIILTEKRS